MVEKYKRVRPVKINPFRDIASNLKERISMKMLLMSPNHTYYLNETKSVFALIFKFRFILLLLLVIFGLGFISYRTQIPSTPYELAIKAQQFLNVAALGYMISIWGLNLRSRKVPIFR